VIIKLYKNINGSFRYYEAWDNKKEIIIHWGELGTVGEDKILTLKRGETASSIIKKELTAPRADGYKEIDIDNHKTLVIQYKTETWGDEKDLEKRYEVEGIANETLGWTGNGHCDGGQIGSGSIEIFSYVIDPHIACQSLVTDLEKKEFLEGAIIAYENEDEEYVVIYPKDFQGEFDFI
jgi:predicted DNA-binding WGR domain protein